MDIYWFMLILLSINQTRSVVVTITPENIAVDVGTHSVHFACTIELEMVEATSEHWIEWYKNNQRIANNNTVLVNPTKYRLYEVSSAGIIHYTQILQIYDIDEVDSGTYKCILIFSSYPLNEEPEVIAFQSIGRITIDFPQPTCFNETIHNSQTGQNILQMSCSYPLKYSQTTLQWIDNDDMQLSTHQPLEESMGEIILTTAVNIESNTNNQWFTCRATRPGSVETRKCIIGNKDLTLVTTASDNIITKLISDVAKESEDQLQTSIIPDYTTSTNSTDDILPASKDENIISIIIVGVLAGMFVIFIIVLIVVRKRKNTKNNLEANNKVTGAITAIDNTIEDNPCYNIQFDNVDQKVEYMNFGTDTDHLEPSYAAVNKTKVKEPERHKATDDCIKVINYPAPNGDLYAQVDKLSKSIPGRNTTAPNEDLYAQVDKTTKSIPGRNMAEKI